MGAYGYGLADITGNLWEYTASEDGWKRIVRGGGWLNTTATCNVAERLSVNPEGTHYDYGFRVCR